MNILILDVYPKKNFRISKDTSGGYGTANDFGDNFISKILKKLIKSGSNWPPLFAAYSLSCLKKNNHNVIYSKEFLEDFNDFDYIFLVSSIVSHETEIKTINHIKKKNLKIKIFAIGPFASNNENLYLDKGIGVIKGEPEFYFYKDKNLDCLKDNNIINSYQEKIDIDDLPYPDWPSMQVNFNRVNILFGNKRSVPIIATRGCPFSCFDYCVYPLQQGRKVRQRDSSKIIDEIIFWKKKYNISMFIFRDPVFSINREHTIAFCNEILSRKIKINFIIETHLKIIDSELIKILKASGLKGVKVGIENYSEEILKDSKRFTVKRDEQLEKINELKRNKIMISAMYILGFPTDNEESVNKTIEYSIKLNTFYAQFNIWTPYPGTPAFNNYSNIIITNTYEHFNMHNLVFKHKNFSREQLYNLLGKAYKNYYFRIKWFLNYCKLYFSN